MLNPQHKAAAATLPWLVLAVMSLLLGACAGAPPIDAQASFLAGLLGASLEARASLGTAIEFCFSWQPTQETFSPGMPTNQLRMMARALPS